MDQYSTEEQQVEAIKKFWKENGTAIVLGAVLGFGGLWGWRYYNAQMIGAQERTSDAYNAAVEKLGVEDSAVNQAKSFIESNSDTQYAVMAAFRLSKEAADKGDLQEARKQLQWIVDNESSMVLKEIALIRLARVQAELEDYSAALASIQKVTSESHKGTVEEVKGDIYQRQGKLDEAEKAYTAALENSEGNNNNFLQMKLDDLAAQKQS
ncbi:tetratricopeptide repeat protein [Paraneptunicella aestuarii]|uniref:YfgM family protein n=1 Tax=Paraneptunicella aestuarii TaxID=2831148 RepID=UPI001E55B8A3|nr:tetratricopeptide repeat protein [Paraneptunicella aestuarii]UAA39437.1 tetratricopeptide repeat protein [Paraneptunicella aestuarii]